MMLVREHRSSMLFSYLSALDTVLKHKSDTAYTVPPLLFSYDYMIVKLICRLTRHGRKSIASRIFINALRELKHVIGFQPFFAFKDISFGMRQLFKIYKVTIRKTKVIHTPAILKQHNQISYGLNNLLLGARQIHKSEHAKMHVALAVMLCNCFIRSHIGTPFNR